MLTAIGLASLLILAACAWAFGETRLAEANNLPRAYETRLFPLFRNLYLAGMVAGALGAGVTFGLVQ